MGFGKKTIHGYSIGKKIGSGKFSDVMMATHIESGDVYALKVIKKKNVKDESDWVRIRREAEVLTNLDHPNIINLWEVFETSNTICIVTDWAAGGDLFDYIVNHGNKRLDPPAAFHFFRQMLSAMTYCHARYVVHRDLKPENIFLTEDKRVKIGDFGFSRTFSPGDPLSTPCGSFAYAAPEVITGQKYLGPAADVWSLGCILYVMLTGTHPFKGSNNFEKLQKIKEGLYTDSPYLINDRTRAFFKEIFHPYASKRPTVREIAKHQVVWQDKPLLAMLIRPFANKISNPYQNSQKVPPVRSHHPITVEPPLRRSFSETELRKSFDALRVTNEENSYIPSISITPPETKEEPPEKKKEKEMKHLVPQTKHKRANSSDKTNTALAFANLNII